MKKIFIGILLTVLMTFFLTACTAQSEKKTTIKNTQEEQKALQEENELKEILDPDTKFPGDELGDADKDEEDSSMEKYEDSVNATKDDTTETVPEKKEETEPTEKNTYGGDLLEPPAENSAGDL